MKAKLERHKTSYSLWPHSMSHFWWCRCTLGSSRCGWCDSCGLRVTGPAARRQLDRAGRSCRLAVSCASAAHTEPVHREGSGQGASHLPELCRLGQDHKEVLTHELGGKFASGSLEVRVLMQCGLDVLVCTMWKRPGELEHCTLRNPAALVMTGWRSH